MLVCPFCGADFDDIGHSQEYCRECGDEVCEECIENGLCPDCNTS